jgi:hypothetical protein
MVLGQDRSTVHSASVILGVLDALLAHLAVTAVVFIMCVCSVSNSSMCSHLVSYHDHSANTRHMQK